MFAKWPVMVMLFGAGIGVGALGNTFVNAASDSPVKVENLLRSELEVVEGIEVVISRVEIAADAALPRHHHPGEEFVYVIDGEATLWQAGKADTVLRAGDAFKVPLEQVHTAITGSHAATAIVFRVHRKGEPDRIPD